MAVTTNGSPQGPVITTDSKVGGRIFVGTTAPSGALVGDLWIDNTTGTNITSLLNSWGDLLTHNGTAQTILPWGSNNKVLVTDDTTATGLAWASKGIRSSTSSTLATDFFGSTGINQTYTNMRIVWTGTQSVADQGFWLRFNDIATATYNWSSNNGTSVYGASADTAFGLASVQHGPMPSYVANYAYTGEVVIYNYSSSTAPKTVTWKAVGRTSTGTPIVSSGMGMWANNAAITKWEFRRASGTTQFAGSFTTILEA